MAHGTVEDQEFPGERGTSEQGGGTGMSSEARKRLGEIIGARGYITERKIAQLLSRAQNQGKKIGEILVDEGYISEKLLASALDEQRTETKNR
jgi:hypothetical protein